VGGKAVVSNTFFDTTRANAEFQGARCIDIPCAEALRPGEEHPFKGNIDLEKLEELLADEEIEVACVVLTVTNNSGGGQPASLANAKAASAICRRAGIPFYLDACRFAENAYFIKQREEGQGERSVEAIAREVFGLADGATFSAKKDGLANIGGFLATQDSHLAQAQKNLLILTEGFPTYGGLAGRDLDAITVGLREVVQEDYLRYRIASTRYLGEGLLKAGIPIVRPPGGHAIYVDGGAFLPHIPPGEFPGHAVACAFYEEGGIRGCEIGTLMFGGKDPETGQERTALLELYRMAIPRRVYTQSHVDYVIEVAGEVARRREKLRGYRIVEEAPQLRHFSARLAPLGD
jgi:tryptophanase